MIKRIYRIYLKLELIFVTINSKLPTILRITKFGLITTCISFIIASCFSVVHAKDTNLGIWIDSQLPLTVKAANNIVSGKVVYYEQQGYYEIKGSLLVAANNLIVDVYNNTDQVSGSTYIADTLNSAGISQPVYAQATGYRTFQPVLNVWRIMRNIALGLIILIGLILSTMILLRVKQGQGYVTILSALPKLLITVILIILSYSISGLLIDVGNIGEKVVLSLFYKADFIEPVFYNAQSTDPNRASYPANIYGSLNLAEPEKSTLESHQEDFNVFRLLSRFTDFETWGEVPCGEREQPDWYADQATSPDMCPLRAVDIIRSPTNIPTLDRGLDIATDLPVEDLLKLILTIVIITGVLKIFFSLVSSFAKIIIYTIFAPIVFLLLPVSVNAVSGWLRYFLASSLVFPIAFMMMFLAAIIVGDPHAPWFTREAQFPVAGFAPNLLVYSTATSDKGVPYLTKIIGLLIVMMIPFLEKYLMEVLRVPENMMLSGAKESIKGVVSKIPILGGITSM